MRKRIIAALAAGVMSISMLVTSPSYVIDAAGDEVVVTEEQTVEGTYSYESCDMPDADITPRERGEKILKRLEEEVAANRVSTVDASSTKSVVINADNFPDDNFRKALAELDYDKDNKLVIKEVESLWLDGKDIKSLKGIEYFTELKDLRAGYNKITSVDLSKNKKIDILYLGDNELKKIDVSNMTGMILLDLSCNKLKEIDITHNSKLLGLDLGYNNLTSIDISKNPKLNVLWLDSNKIKYVDASNNSEIISYIPSKGGALTVEMKAHVQKYGWDEIWAPTSVGTIGAGLRLEAFEARALCTNKNGKFGYYPEELTLEYRTHVQSYGWENDWKKNGEMSGTSGEAKRIEAIEMKLSGKVSNLFDVYYRVHAQSFGDLGWAMNGAKAGTAGLSKRIENVVAWIIPKGSYPVDYKYDDNGNPVGIYNRTYAYIELAKNVNEDVKGNVMYMTHVQSYGDQSYVADGSISGTVGEAKRLEGLRIKLRDENYITPVINMPNDDIEDEDHHIYYRSHVQTYGWEENWKQDGDLSGTVGEGKRLEAVEIKINKELNEYYDVYYRVHVQSYGWLDWACNGEPAGTEGLGKRLEGIQIVLVAKDLYDPTTKTVYSCPPGPVDTPFISAK